MGYDAYREITEKFIAALEMGVAPWVRPWSIAGCGQPYNGRSGHSYHGLNVWLLVLAGYGDPRWYTYKQAQELKAQVRAGAKATKVFFWTFIKKTEKITARETGEETTVTRKIPVIKIYNIFNAEQIDGLPALADVPDVNPADGYQRAQAIADAYQVITRHGGGEASYCVGTDTIRMPEPGRFQTVDDYWGTRLHEMAHSTGHKDRLNRQLGNRFGSDAYAMEELVAEMGAAFLCATAGIDGKLQHTEYIVEWANRCRADKYALFKAASLAQAAAHFILNGGKATRTEEEPTDAEMTQAA